MSHGVNACKELHSHLTVSDYDIAKSKHNAKSSSPLAKSNADFSGKHRSISKNGVHDLLDCPSCKNLMYPPIFQVQYLLCVGIC